MFYKYHRAYHRKYEHEDNKTKPQIIKNNNNKYLAQDYNEYGCYDLIGGRAVGQKSVGAGEPSFLIIRGYL